MREAGDHRVRAIKGSLQKAVHESSGTERLTAEEVDDELTDLLFGQPAESPRREDR